MNIDVSSFGGSKDEALKNLKEALELYYEDEPSSDFTMIEQAEIVHTEIHA